MPLAGSAAFGRLCVETSQGTPLKEITKAAAFGRLCVETPLQIPLPLAALPAAFGRLCVETISSIIASFLSWTAAFGRLCVETSSSSQSEPKHSQPPSGGCVLKQANQLADNKVAGSRLRAAVC